MVSPKGWEIWVMRSRDSRSCPSNELCSILSKKASTQYRRWELGEHTGLMSQLWANVEERITADHVCKELTSEADV